MQMSELIFLEDITMLYIVAPALTIGASAATLKLAHTLYQLTTKLAEPIIQHKAIQPHVDNLANTISTIYSEINYFLDTPLHD